MCKTLDEKNAMEDGGVQQRATYILGECRRVFD